MKNEVPGVGWNRFAYLLKYDLEKRGLPLKQFAEKAKITYEHARKLVRGEAFPSSALLKRIGDVLELGRERRHHFEVSISIDKIERKYFNVIPMLLRLDRAGAEFARELAPDWNDLTDEQQNFFRDQIRLAAESNRRRLPAGKTTPHKTPHTDATKSD